MQKMSHVAWPRVALLLPRTRIPSGGVGLPTVRLLHFLDSWSGLLAWAFVGLVAFGAVVLAIRVEATNLRAWTRGRKTANRPADNVGQ